MAALEVEGLVKTFVSRKKTVQAVGGVSFRVEAGEVVGLLGPNGAGKTTTIKCILGLMTATAGRIHVNGFDLARQRRQVIKSVGAVLEGSRNIYWRMTARENLEFFAGLHGLGVRAMRPYVAHILDLFGLTHRQHWQVQELSSGMRQKVAVSCALITRAPVVFLDEPTLGLDVETSYELRQTLRELAAGEGRTIVLSSHDMDVVQDVCSRVIIIKAGRIITDEKVERLLAVFRTRAYRFTVSGGKPTLGPELTRRFPGAVMTQERDRLLVELTLGEGPAIFELMGLFRDAGAAIDSIGQQEPDLEQAFLQLVRGEARC